MDVAELGISVRSNGLTKAQRDLRNFGNESERVERKTVKAMDAIDNKIRSLAAPLAGAFAGAFAAGSLLDQSRLVADTKILAETLKISAGALQEWQYAGEQVNISAEKMGDIFKDASDKIGDFVATGGGEAKDLFENLNLDIAELRRLAPDQQLLKIGEAISRIPDASQRVFFLEALADDASRLLPLLENNAEALRRYSAEARSLGIALDDDDIDRVADAARAMKLLSANVRGLSNELLAGLGPGLAAGVQGLSTIIREAGGAEKIMDRVGAAAIALAAIYGVNLVGSLRAKVAASIEAAAADQAAAAVTAKRIAMEADMAAMQARRAAAEKTSAVTSARVAQQRAAAAKVETAAQLQSIQLTQQQLVAERTLETQRLQAQISAIGRQQSLARLAEIRRAEVALSAQSATASRAMTAANAAEASATRALRIAKLELTAATTAANAALTGTATAATAATTRIGLLTVATRGASAAQIVMTGTARAMSGAVALVGGPLGAATLAAIAMGYYAANIDKAKLSAQQSIGPIDQLALSLRELYDLIAGNRIGNEVSSMASGLAKNSLDEVEGMIGRTATRINELREVQSKGFWGDMFDGSYDTAQRNLEGQEQRLAALQMAWSKLKQAKDEANAGEVETGGGGGMGEPGKQLEAYRKLKAQLDDVAAINKAYADSVLEITNADLTLTQKQELLTLAARKRADAIQDLNDKQTKGADDATESIRNHISALEEEAVAFGMSRRESELLRLEREGASAAELRYANTILSTIEALEKRQQAEENYRNLVSNLRTEEERRTETIREQMAVLAQMEGLSGTERKDIEVRIVSNANGLDNIEQSLMTEEERLRSSYERRRAMILDYTQRTGIEKNEVLRRLDEEFQMQMDELNATYWDKWLSSAESALTNMDERIGATLDNITQRFGDTFESAIFDSENAGDAVRNMFIGLGRQAANTLGQMAAQWLMYQAVQKLTGKTAATSAASMIGIQAQAQSQLAALNAFASTAAIPIVGPAAAPAAAAAALAATQPMAASITALSAGMVGVAHDGIDNVPREGTWLLDRGERVVDRRTNADLKEALASGGFGGGGGNTSVNVKAVFGDADFAAAASDWLNSSEGAQTLTAVFEREGLSRAS
ncbi:hypothetical protein GCM10011348_45760 [Marinobacterium nitratireducens]|uniref:Uncharacterized protein n=1 Tax=Marinobacterium nitratireducens TaxID=518897 RepID=A0A917ZRQ1_9GAMM|nr:hypothetical protein [Marinobacterium nitratireducens]GGO89010.1 hypothetical protein GCM10011348_45760 [Marinobacterium nitratireducens]